ncbi:hypothetical protein [Ureibacillus aquaedulcis]|uniref:Uncharacterized protein n=1 Tax=Ureibacillus aquaedulcis TaxID=3058421 RepID=A0ABT8GU36_9BACL|nr:hypothetical protein [Ureibacillus sp. BA0131]MDN4494928.1 hypothetical protein [Ureibacillus sp. BA0131]
MFIHTMKKEIKELFPQWANEKLDRNLTMTNDLDSLVSCSLLNMIFGYKVNYYYSFKGLFRLDDSDKRKSIGVDLAIDGYTWDNHVTKIYANSYVNPHSANLNAINGISKENYYQKYAGSTALQIWSYYDLPLPPTDDGKLFLLTIDSAYLGHYKKEYKSIHNEYLRQLGFEELIELLDNTPEWKLDFSKIGEQLSFKNGEIYYPPHSIDYVEKMLGIKLILPKGQFTQIAEYEADKDRISHINTSIFTKEKMFSFALTGMNYIKYSMLKEKSE